MYLFLPILHYYVSSTHPVSLGMSQTSPRQIITYYLRTWTDGMKRIKLNTDI